jgi:hemerythrin-like domain-containing protein
MAGPHHGAGSIPHTTMRGALIAPYPMRRIYPARPMRSIRLVDFREWQKGYSSNKIPQNNGGNSMLPIGPLMIEHRLIEKMITVIQREIKNSEQQKKINPEFVDLAVDFIRTYADRCHHGKEEDILFRDLSQKSLSGEQRQIMDELLEEHRQGRRVVAGLVEAKRQYLNGNQAALSEILSFLRFLVNFYPKHIEKEDQHFFMPMMNYLSPAEKEGMLREELEFDKNLIHEIYKKKIIEAEKLLDST